MPSETLERALFSPDGPVDVTKIEIEILDDGRCKWNLFSGCRRIYSAVARRRDQPAMLESTRLLVDTMSAEHMERAHIREERED